MIMKVYFCVHVTNNSALHFCNFNEKVNSTWLFYGHADPISSLFNLPFRVSSHYGETVRYIPPVNNLPLCPSEEHLPFLQKSLSFKYSRQITECPSKLYLFQLVLTSCDVQITNRFLHKLMVICICDLKNLTVPIFL